MPIYARTRETLRICTVHTVLYSTIKDPSIQGEDDFQTRRVQKRVRIKIL